MTHDDLIADQLAKWVAGESVHNDERDECCPDFSCCKPMLLAPKDVREKFMAADDEGRLAFLGHFLAAMIAAAGTAKVHIAGEGQEQ